MDFNRAYLKSQAKEIIQGKLFKMFLPCVVLMIMGAGFLSVRLDTVNYTAQMYLFGSMSFSINYHRALQMAAPLGILGLLWSVAIAMPSRVSKARYFLNSANQEEQFSDVLTGFKENYGHNISVMFTTDLFIFLWTLLLIVPGIMKAYSYKFVSYLAAEYPELSGQELRRISSEMTYGYKFNLFGLDLSFFFWNLLGAFLNGFTFGLGSSLITPYIEQTHERTYQLFKESRTFEEAI